MQRKDRIDLVGAIALVSISALLGLNQVLIKIMTAGIAPGFQAGLRSAIAVCALLLFCLIVRRRLMFSRATIWIGLFSGCLFQYR